MKNPHIERMRAAAKKRGAVVKQRSTWDHELGIDVRHVYSDDRTLSYWDDVAYMQGKRRVTVFWTHPRYMYRAVIEQQVYNTLAPAPAPFIKGTPVYRAIGKTKKRKRVVSYRTEINVEPARDEFYQNWHDVTEAALLTSDFKQQCSFKVIQLRTGRGVEICSPHEVRNKAELLALTEFVRACLADRTLFTRTYGEYAYTCLDHASEQELAPALVPAP